MRSMCKLVVRNHMNLVHSPRRDRMCFVYHVYMTRRDRDMTSRSPICMMHRNRS